MKLHPFQLKKNNIFIKVIYRVIQVFDRNKKKLYIRNKENIYSFKFYSPDQNKLLKKKKFY